MYLVFSSSGITIFIIFYFQVYVLRYIIPKRVLGYPFLALNIH